MAKTKTNCLYCSKEILVENKEIKRGFGKFCSRQHANQFRADNLAPIEPNVKCAHCSKFFYMFPSKMENSKSGLFFCCREHKDISQRLGGVKEIMPSHYGTGSGIHKYRHIAFETKPKICERCGFDKEPAIIVHHRDRNRENNLIENLEVLCANCHAIEHWGEI